MNVTTISLRDLPADLLKRPLPDQISNRAPISLLHQREFSVASAIARTLKENLTDDMSSICESYLTNKLTAQFRGLAKFEEGKAGTRPIYLTKYGKQLCGFDFNSSAPYKEIFKAKYFVKPGSRRGQVILHFPGFIPQKALQAPAEATHFKMSARLIALSDFGYHPQENSYHAISHEFHGRCASFDTGKLPLLKMPIDSITAQLCVDQKAVPENTSLVLVMSVSFYTYEKGRYSHLNKASTMQIEQVL